jgi:hypothetical protein
MFVVGVLVFCTPVCAFVLATATLFVHVRVVELPPLAAAGVGAGAAAGAVGVVGVFSLTGCAWALPGVALVLRDAGSGPALDEPGPAAPLLFGLGLGEPGVCPAGPVRAALAASLVWCCRRVGLLPVSYRLSLRRA